MNSLQTAIISHGEVETEPAEIYGTGPVLVRIGNGGAGATGLLRALATDYLSTLPGPARSIPWICNHSRNTQLALLHAHIDVALTYERTQEALAAAEGWSLSRGCVMHDHFLLAGPAADPAGVMAAPSLADALRRIADKRVLFHSRADASATMFKERGLWAGVGLAPWEGGSEGWYKTSVLAPSAALARADAAGAYLLTDRSTLLRLVAGGGVRGTTVFWEPGSEGDVLMNSCFALCSPSAGAEVGAFVEYLLGERAQGVVEEFGREEVGLPFFARAGDGFAGTALRGGRAVGGKWVGGGLGGGPRCSL